MVDVNKDLPYAPCAAALRISLSLIAECLTAGPAQMLDKSLSLVAITYSIDCHPSDLSPTTQDFLGL